DQTKITNIYGYRAPANLAAPSAASSPGSLALEPPGMERLALSALNDTDDEAAIRQDNRRREGESSRGKSGTQVWKRDRRRPTVPRVFLCDGNSVELVSLKVSVTVVGPRARTVVDHVFRNPHDRQLEGTFEYPLPTGASPAYFAMYQGQARDRDPNQSKGPDNELLPQGLPAPPRKTADSKSDEHAKQTGDLDWGKPQEARVVAKDKALETYEDVVRQKVDPALLEYAGGNTFSGRVFPVGAKGYNRVVLAYEETLPATAEGAHYRFALPSCNLEELDFNLTADKSAGSAQVIQPSGGTVSEAPEFSYSRSWKKKGPGREVVIAFRPPHPEVQVIAGRNGESGPCYLYARVRPQLKAEK